MHLAQNILDRSKFVCQGNGYEGSLGVLSKLNTQYSLTFDPIGISLKLQHDQFTLKPEVNDIQTIKGFNMDLKKGGGGRGRKKEEEKLLKCLACQIRSTSPKKSLVILKLDKKRSVGLNQVGISKHSLMFEASNSCLIAF